jgi:glc operon protein GlcG
MTTRRSFFRTRLLVLLPVLALLTWADASAQFLTRHELSLEGARQVAEAARNEALANGWNVAIAVVDAAGHLIYFERLPDTQPASVDIAITKARSAARFKRSTKTFEEGIAAGRLTLLSLDISPFEGGLPIIHEGTVVAAIGVSGVTPQQDGIVAQAGVDALTAE